MYLLTLKQLQQVQRGRSTSQGNEPHQLQILYWMVACSTKGNFYVIHKQTVAKIKCIILATSNDQIINILLGSRRYKSCWH